MLYCLPHALPCRPEEDVLSITRSLKLLGRQTAACQNAAVLIRLQHMCSPQAACALSAAMGYSGLRRNWTNSAGSGPPQSAPLCLLPWLLLLPLQLPEPPSDSLGSIEGPGLGVSSSGSDLRIENITTCSCLSLNCFCNRAYWKGLT